METMSYPAVVTFWFVTAADPAEVLRAEPKADRGFGRKLLSQLNPAWPITPIGQFPLNRSSKPGRDEFYIAGYPGVAVVQTFVEDAAKLSETASYLRGSLAAADTYLFAEGTNSGYAGMAHFVGDELRRSLTAARENVLEDAGLPEAFEAPFWAGETAEQLGGITLPFEPKELVREAQRQWLGIELVDGPDVHVVGYAVDGRPEPKIAQPEKPRTKSVGEVAAKFAENDTAYDDYEVAEADETGDEFAELADASVAAARRVRRSLRRRVSRIRAAIRERIRHADR